MRKFIVMKCGLVPSLNGNCSIIAPEICEEDTEEDLKELNEFAITLDVDGPTSLPDVAVGNIKHRILAYIAGYVVSRLLRNMKCSSCRPALEDSLDDPLEQSVGRLIRLKDRGGLKKPSGSTYKIILRVQEVFLSEIAGKTNLPNTPNLLTYLTLKVLRLLDVNLLFPSLSRHVLEQNPAIEEMHHIKVAKMLVFRFLKVRSLSYCDVLNRRQQQGTSSRNKNLKSTHFRNE